MLPRVRLTRTTLMLSTLVVTVILFLTFCDSRPSLSIDNLPTPARHITNVRTAKKKKPQQEHVPHPEAQPVPDRWHTPQMPVISESLDYAPDGLVRGMHKIYRALKKTGHAIQDEQHPISELVERGRRRWEGLLKR